MSDDATRTTTVEQHPAAPPRGVAVGALAALTVGAAASYGGFGAFGPLLRGDAVRGLVVVALLLLGAGLAVSAPYRLRGWWAALVGAAVAGALHGVAVFRLVVDGQMLTAAQAMAAGFALGGVLSVAGALPATRRALLSGALTAGLVLGIWTQPVTYLLAAVAVICAALAAARSAPPGQVPLTVVPLAAVLLAAVIVGALVQGLGTLPSLGLLVAGPLVVAAAAHWLSPSPAR